MDTIRGWGGRRQSDLDEIEAKLAQLLKPVDVPADFTRDLKRRLITVPDVSMSAPQKALYGPVFLAAASLLSGGVLVVMTIKGIRKLKVGSVGTSVKKEKMAEPV